MKFFVPAVFCLTVLSPLLVRCDDSHTTTAAECGAPVELTLPGLLNITECLQLNLDPNEISGYDSSKLGALGKVLMGAPLKPFMEANPTHFPFGPTDLNLSFLTSCSKNQLSVPSLLFRVYRIVHCLDVKAVATDVNAQAVLFNQLSLLIVNLLKSISF